MGGLFSNFFGGASSKSKVTQTPNWNPQQQQEFNDLYSQIQKTGLGPAPSSPDAYVPRTAQDQQYFDYANSEAVKKMATGEVPYDVGPEFANQYFEQSIRPIAEREWRETTRPGIEEAYAGSTFNSTGRLDAITKATEKYGEGLAAQKAGLIYNEEKARRAAIDAAYGRIPAGQDVAAKSAAYARGIETEKVMNSVQKYLMGESVNGQYNPAYNPMVTLAFNLLGLKPFTSNVQTESEGAGLGYSFLKSAINGINLQGIFSPSESTQPTGTQAGGSTAAYGSGSAGGMYGTGTGVGSLFGTGEGESLPWYSFMG
jgi:hypothetical protein